MLAARFSGRWDESIAKDRDGNFFIDQPIELFLPMIDFIRSKQSQTSLVTDHPSPALSDFAGNERKYNDFKQMVEYFGVTPKIFPVELVDYTASDPERLASSLSCSSLQVATNEWMICGLAPSGHARKITGFEVKVGEAVNLQIGWVKNSIQTNTDVSSHHRRCLELDFARGGIHCVDGEFVSVINALKNGTFVKCKNFGKEWFIDGTSFTGNWNITWGAYVPAISGKGEWTITSVELEP